MLFKDADKLDVKSLASLKRSVKRKVKVQIPAVVQSAQTLKLDHSHNSQQRR